MTFDPTKPVQTVSGCKVKVLMTDRPSTCDLSIVAIVLTSVDGSPRPNPMVEYYQADGRHRDWCPENYPLNLMNVPPPVRKHSTWQNIYIDTIDHNGRIGGNIEWPNKAEAIQRGQSAKNLIGHVRRDYENDRFVKAELEVYNE